MNSKYLAIVNPAAGGGRCGRMATAALEELSRAGLAIDRMDTKSEGDATKIARTAYAAGVRKFIVVGGDGTAYEIVNGLFPEATAAADLNRDDLIPTLGFLPLGTGNSFLRDFTPGAGAEAGLKLARTALLAGRTQPCDVFRLRHREGEIFFTNLLSVGFAADVNMARTRRFKAYGPLGYWLAIFTRLARLERRAFPVRAVEDAANADATAEFDRRRCLFLAFSNSKFTGGTMKIAPLAETADGWIEYVRWGPIGRLGLVANLPGLYSGAHIQHPMAERMGAKRIEFALEEPVDVMVDGEAATLHCEAIDVLPGALRVAV